MLSSGRLSKDLGVLRGARASTELEIVKNTHKNMQINL